MQATKRQFNMIRTYGVDTDVLDELIHNPMTKITGLDMLVMSILSDAQHVLEHGDYDTARQFMNRAKYVLSYRMKEERNA